MTVQLQCNERTHQPALTRTCRACHPDLWAIDGVYLRQSHYTIDPNRPHRATSHSCTHTASPSALAIAIVRPAVPCPSSFSSFFCAALGGLHGRGKFKVAVRILTLRTAGKTDNASAPMKGRKKEIFRDKPVFAGRPRTGATGQRVETRTKTKRELCKLGEKMFFDDDGHIRIKRRPRARRGSICHFELARNKCTFDALFCCVRLVRVCRAPGTLPGRIFVCAVRSPLSVVSL